MAWFRMSSSGKNYTIFDIIQSDIVYYIKSYKIYNYNFKYLNIPQIIFQTRLAEFHREASKQHKINVLKCNSFRIFVSSVVQYNSEKSQHNKKNLGFLRKAYIAYYEFAKEFQKVKSISNMLCNNLFLIEMLKLNSFSCKF